jgi:hypothetical protein
MQPQICAKCKTIRSQELCDNICSGWSSLWLDDYEGKKGWQYLCPICNEAFYRIKSKAIGELFLEFVKKDN